MPTYEYACRDCGEHVEVVQSFRDAPLTTCGACGGTLRKVFSAAGIIFKGSGYYVTDTRKGAASGASSGGSSATPKSGDGKSGDGKSADGKSGDSSSSSDGSSSSSSDTKAAESA